MKKDERAQVFIIILWVLAILALLAVGIGRNTSLALRLSGFQKKKLLTLYLARAGLLRAIAEIAKDPTPAYDASSDSWADNEEVFKKIVIPEDENGFAVVSYVYEEGGEEKERFGVRDEESKININTSGQEVLAALLERSGLASADALILADNIRAWRSSLELVPAQARDYQGIGYSCKGAAFANVQELLLVKGMDEEVFAALQPLVTVFSSSAVNINTAAPELLEVLLFAARQAAIDSGSPVTGNTQEALSKILQYRQEHGFFTQENLNNLLTLLALNPADFSALINEFSKLVVVQSVNFRIITTGRMNSGKVHSLIECVYNRQKAKPVFYHER
ncbi:MAG: type II secretion system protein GspK [Candidatus Omnitrophica bacterium]|nr:type II secretion system protein GspK [Candidatus Omnitrophota bacterium]MDD5513273.1 type II secretion system protein GspK [Candidatus Omnitrophota bacterium]